MGSNARGLLYLVHRFRILEFVDYPKHPPRYSHNRRRGEWEMDELDVYVVRVYRKGTSGVAGVIQAIRSGEQLPFQTSDQLWRALHDLPSLRYGNQHSQSNEEVKK